MIKLAARTALFASLLLSLYACAGQNTPDTTGTPVLNQVTLDGQTLTLENQQGRCALRKPDQTSLILEMEWPCQFSLNREGRPRVELFNAVEIIIVKHTDAEPAPSRECRSQYQAVRQLKGQLQASVVSRNASCMRGPVDQKNFVGLFQW